MSVLKKVEQISSIVVCFWLKERNR